MDTVRASRALAVAALMSGALVIAGCGSDETPNSGNRPPSPINITASISSKRVSISPTTFGAGPIVLIITNQSGRSQDVTLETDELAGKTGGITQSTGPINPQDTAQLQADLREGTYSVSTDSDAIRAATIDVTESRESAQGELLLP